MSAKTQTKSEEGKEGAGITDSVRQEVKAFGRRVLNALRAPHLLLHLGFVLSYVLQGSARPTDILAMISGKEEPSFNMPITSENS